MRRTRRVRGIGAIPASFVLCAAATAALAAAGCGGPAHAPGGGGYAGLTADARITAENAAPLTAVALGIGTGLDAFIGRATAGTTKAGEDYGPLPPLPLSVPPPVHAKALHVAQAAENADVLGFDYLVPGPAGGQVRVYGTLWPDGTGALVTAFEAYGRGDGYTLDGNVSYLIVARDASNGRITAMDIRLSAFAVADAAADLLLDGAIAVSSTTPGRVENRLDLEGLDRVSGKAFRYSDFLLVRAAPAGGAPAEDVAGEAFEGAAGRLMVSTDAPVAYSAGVPVGGGPVRLFGAEGTAARVTPRSDGTAQIAVDEDGDGGFESVRDLAWDSIR